MHITQGGTLVFSGLIDHGFAMRSGRAPAAIEALTKDLTVQYQSRASQHASSDSDESFRIKRGGTSSYCGLIVCVIYCVA